MSYKGATVCKFTEMSIDRIHGHCATSFWGVNNEAHCAHNIDFARVLSTFMPIANWYTNNLSAFGGGSFNDTLLLPLGVHFLFSDVKCIRSIAMS